MATKKPTVLLVEDNISQTLYLEEVLSDHAFEVSIVNSPDEWRKQKGDLVPDVIVLDIMMPVGREESGRTLGGFLAGVALHKEMHTYYERLAKSMPPVLVLTAIGGAQDEVYNRAKQYFDGLPKSERPVWFDKPPNMDDLTEKLRELASPEPAGHE